MGASHLQAIQERMAGSDANSGVCVQKLIEILTAADAALGARGPDTLNVLTERLRSAHLYTGPAWWKGSNVYQNRATITEAFLKDAEPLMKEAARMVAAQPPPTLARRGTGYALLCAVCGADAALFELKGNQVQCDRLFGASSFHWMKEEAAALTAILAKQNGRDLVKHLAAGQPCDSYCPDCDRVYCHRHYAIEEIWSGSWLESIFAKCPLGHSREIA